jgi:hypothetical protein
MFPTPILFFDGLESEGNETGAPPSCDNGEGVSDGGTGDGEADVDQEGECDSVSDPARCFSTQARWARPGSGDTTQSVTCWR